MHSHKRLNREKVNFMLDRKLVLEMKQYVPEGERSNFANEAFEEALSLLKRRKAMEMIDELRAKNTLRLTTEEIIEAKNYGRK
ncbi:MAG: hypothetical protein WC777_03520 [Candidatus Gracilibacteria bacterium]